MNRIAVGPRQGCKVFTLQSLPASDPEEWGGILDGFSLHAGVAAKAHECNKLGRQQFINLGRYIARSPVAEQHLSLTRNGMDVFLDDFEEKGVYPYYTPNLLYHCLTPFVDCNKVSLICFKVRRF
jgi:hypothetical protein